MANFSTTGDLIPPRFRGCNVCNQPDETAAELFGRIKNRHLHTGVAELDGVFGTIDPGQILEVMRGLGAAFKVTKQRRP